MMVDLTDAHKLAVKMANKAIEISRKNVSTQTAINKRNSAHAHYTDHYNAYVNKFSGSKIYVTIGKTPSLLGVGNPQVPCANPTCDTVYTVGDLKPGAQHPNDTIALSQVIPLSEGHHLATCSQKHSKWKSNWAGNVAKPAIEIAVSDPPPYWNCPNDPGQCSYRMFHNRACKGTCGSEFPTHPNHYNPHWTDCKETVKNSARNTLIGNLITGECNGYYYSCTQTSADCIHATYHRNGDDDSTASNPTPTPTPSPSPPSMHACNVHETWQSGDHSLTYCYKTNANGTCTVGTYYACEDHTCVFPDPPTPPNMVACSHCFLWYDSNTASEVTYHTDTKPCWHCWLQIPMCMTSYSITCSGGTYGFHQRDN